MEKEALEIVTKYSRDNGRTPFQWDNSVNARFTIGTPWLTMNSNYRRIHCKEQETREDSVLSFYKKLIQLRKHNEYKETIVYGDFEPIFEKQDNILDYYHKGNKNTLLVVTNYQNEKQSIVLPQEYKKIILNNYSKADSNGKDMPFIGTGQDHRPS